MSNISFESKNENEIYYLSMANQKLSEHQLKKFSSFKKRRHLWNHDTVLTIKENNKHKNQKVIFLLHDPRICNISKKNHYQEKEL